MKKILLLFVLVGFMSCDIGGDDGPSFQLELMSITSVNIPDQFTFGETHEITVNYLRPNGCHEFNNFIFQPDGNTRTVAVVDTVYDDPNCSPNAVDASVSFDFRVVSNEPYIFQFYQGSTQTGEDQYLIIEVPVVD
ncbi:hypothetical protein [Winogradskyella jejuensis]|uniref:Lipoprotein n=1 Tax=Winogradskyella jejuensis TaxID=1089305 RepID=A0A1M5MML5_9FLAO|nr:hypothetical protein [Winogradskyella jejuensis]SHG78538.1 hypothetical protein SAMN05444148_0939 [Winogradskyella jejuensis]